MEKIIEILQDLLGKYKQKTLEAVSKLIRYQEAFINTTHPDFTEAIINSEEYHEIFLKFVTVGHDNEITDSPTINPEKKNGRICSIKK